MQVIAFWIGRASLLEEVSYETLVWRLGASLLEEVALVLETWRLTFGGSLVRNARFGDLALHFWKSRTKRSFWRLGAALLEEVSYETLVLETWRFGASLLEEVLYETLILETWRFTCGAGLRPGQFVVVRERAYGSWTQKLFGAGFRPGQFVVQM